MKLFVLTCINEELDIVEQHIFTTFLEASHKMAEEFDREKMSMLQENGEDYVSTDALFGESATLVYGDQPYQYEWKIREVEC